MKTFLKEKCFIFIRLFLTVFFRPARFNWLILKTANTIGAGDGICRGAITSIYFTEECSDNNIHYMELYIHRILSLDFCSGPV